MNCSRILKICGLLVVMLYFFSPQFVNANTTNSLKLANNFDEISLGMQANVYVASDAILSLFDYTKKQILNTTKDVLSFNKDALREFKSQLAYIKNRAKIDIVEPFNLVASTYENIGNKVSKVGVIVLEKNIQTAGVIDSESLSDGFYLIWQSTYGKAVEFGADILEPLFIPDELNNPSVVNITSKNTNSAINNPTPNSASTSGVSNTNTSKSTTQTKTQTQNSVFGFSLTSILQRLANLESRVPTVTNNYTTQQVITPTYLENSISTLASSIGRTSGAAGSVSTDALRTELLANTDLLNTSTFSSIVTTSSSATSTFAGNASTTGHAIFGGNVVANAFYGDGSNLTGITSFSTSTTRGVFSSSATGLDYTSGTGVFSLTSGYNIPLTASTTAWENKVGSQWTTSGSDVYYNGGNVGIGTTTPVSKFTIAQSGTTQNDGIYIGESASSYGHIYSQGGNGLRFDHIYRLTFDSPTYATQGLTVSGGDLDVGNALVNGGANYGGSVAVNDGFYVNGNVGIGTTTPSAKLAITGTAGTGDIFVVASSTEAKLFTITSAGYVGIGNINPGTTLDLSGKMRISPGSGGNYNDGIRINDSSSDYAGIFLGGTALTGASSDMWSIMKNPSDNLEFRSNSAVNMLITAAGSVGVGTTTPSAKLAITGNGTGTDRAFAIANSSNTDTFVVLDSGVAKFGTNPLWVGGYSAGAMLSLGGVAQSSNSFIWWRGGAYPVQLANGVALGGSMTDDGGGGAILMSDARGVLGQRNGTNAQSSRIYNTYTSASNYERGAFNWSSNIFTIGTENSGTGSARALAFMTASTTRMTIDTSGNLGIGTSTPNEQLEITKNFRFPATTGSTVGVFYRDASRFLHTYGTNNLFMGVTAGNFTTTGTGRNIGIGLNSLSSLTDGENNVAIGYNAGNSITTGFYNTGVGASTLNAMTTGFQNVAVGYRSMYALTSGYQNVAIGNQALQGVTFTGNNNVAIGHETMISATSAQRNMAIGATALRALTTGYSNVGIGFTALYALTTGNFNIAIGDSALSTNISGTRNIGIGLSSLLLATGDNNIGVGYLAGDNITTGSSNVVIGYNIDAPSATESNQLNIGNIIFGTSIDGTGTTLSTGKIGIGTTTPSAKLAITGTAGTGDIFRIASSTEASLLSVDYTGALSGGSGGLTMKAGGTNQNITLTPSGTGGVVVYNGTIYSPKFVPSSGYVSVARVDTGINYVSMGAFGHYGIGLYYASGIHWAGTGSDSTVAMGGGADTQLTRLSAGKLSIDTTTDGDSLGTLIVANMGVGTTTPAAKLAVTGTAGTGNIFIVASSTQAILMSVNYTGTIYAANLAGGATNLTTDASGNIIRDPSDERLKENIVSIESSGALDKVLALRGVTFDWKDKTRFGSQNEVGFIAQEVQGVVPEAVSAGGDYLSLSVRPIVAMVVEAIKELNKKIDNIITIITGFADKVQTKELCVGDTCVTEDQLKTLLQNSTQSAQPTVINITALPGQEYSTTGGGDTSTSTNTGADTTASSVTDENTASSTESVVESVEEVVNTNAPSETENATNTTDNTAPNIVPNIEDSTTAITE